MLLDESRGKRASQRVRTGISLLVVLASMVLAWAACVGAEGRQGPQGEQGIPGEQGPAGSQGSRGVAGPPGLQGEAGPAGPQGTPGERGPQGQQGPKGDVGPPGPQGETGIQGVAGQKGEQGPQGEQGIPGVAGPQGPQGGQGPAGADGRDYDPYMWELLDAQIRASGLTWFWTESANDWQIALALDPEEYDWLLFETFLLEGTISAIADSEDGSFRLVFGNNDNRPFLVCEYHYSYLGDRPLLEEREKTLLKVLYEGASLETPNRYDFAGCVLQKELPDPPQ